MLVLQVQFTLPIKNVYDDMYGIKITGKQDMTYVADDRNGREKDPGVTGAWLQ